jgi:hypothetical protein
MAADRRSSTRWRYVDFVGYRSTSVSGEGHLANISDTGVFVRAAALPAPGERVELTLRGSTPPLCLQAEVRWAGPRHDGVVGFGAELVDPPAAYLELVRSIAAQETSEQARRIAPRIELSIPVAVELGTTCDDGVLSDISLSGARLERTGIRPLTGSQVTIIFSLKGHRSPFEVVARVVRATESGGYAVQFEAIDPKLKAALEYGFSVLHALPASRGD